MGLIEQEIKELRDLQKKVLCGDVSFEQAAMQISISNQISKREAMICKIIDMNVKYGMKAMNSASKINLIGYGTAIDLDDSEDVLVCPMQGGTCINREECLDFSGAERNISGCQKCEHFEATRRRLLPC